MRVLGANCGNGFVHFAIVEQRRFVDAEPSRYVLPHAVQGGERLSVGQAALIRDLTRLEPERVALYLPTSRHPPSYPDARARAAVETLLELAAWDKRIPLEIVSGPRVRGALKMKAGAKMEDVMCGLLELSNVPLYWPAGRSEAAAAAWVTGT